MGKRQRKTAKRRSEQRAAKIHAIVVMGSELAQQGAKPPAKPSRTTRRSKPNNPEG